MKENKSHHAGPARNEAEKAIPKNQPPASNQSRSEDQQSPVFHKTVTKLTRRYSFDDNGGGYSGL